MVRWTGMARSCTIVQSSWRWRTVVTARKKGGKIKRPTARAAHYSAAYGNFASELNAEIRAEAFGEDRVVVHRPG